MTSILKVDQLQDSGGNALITSDGSGNLTTQKLLYPAFEAQLTSSQSLSNATDTKVQFDTEIFDTDNCFDNSTNYRFTPTVAGKYFVFAECLLASDAASTFNNGRVYIFKNGSSLTRSQENVSNNNIQNSTRLSHVITEMNGSSDYLEVYVRVEATAGSLTVIGGSALRSLFGAYRIGD